MEGLLEESDFDFLSQQPGFDLGLYRKMRRERLEIFHQYLHRIIADFNRLHLAARLVASQQEGHGAMVASLIWLKVRFGLAALHAECNYRLCKLGLSSLPARHLIAYLDLVSIQAGCASA